MTDKQPADRTRQKLILPPDMITLLAHGGSFLDRDDVRVFPAASNEEALELHRDERTSLIAVHLQRDGLDTRKFCSFVRDDYNLSKVSVIILCPDEPSAVDWSARCRANAVMIKPVHADRFTQAVRRLLSISARTAYRVLLSVTIDASGPQGSFFSRSLNVSPTGILIETEQPMEIGSRIACSFYLPGRTSIRSSCEVVRVENPPAGAAIKTRCCGIRFLDLKAEEKAALEAFIAEKAAENTVG